MDGKAQRAEKKLAWRRLGRLDRTLDGWTQPWCAIAQSCHKRRNEIRKAA